MEEISYKDELNNMDLRLTEMEEKIDSIDDKLTQVMDAIMGNRLTKSGGFIEDINVLKDKIQLLEKRQEKYDEFKKRISWTVGIIVAALIFIQYISNIYSNIK